MTIAESHQTLSLLDGLLQRNSVPPRLFDDTMPSQADIDTMLAAAVTAPDHGMIRPWRFHVIAGAARERLAELFAEAARLREPGAPEGVIEKERGRPFRAPLIIAVCAKVDLTRTEKVPVVEQVVAAASAMQQLVLAADALGYGAIVLTGKNAHDQHVKSAFGLDARDELVGFVYVGHPASPVGPKPRPDAGDFTTVWPA